MIERQPTSWHGLDAWALESEVLRVVVVPELGAKIVSLFDKRAGHEWLVGPMRSPKNVPYAASFTDQDMSGWDEMFPTIDACEYPASGPYYGRPLPDHGEVWSLPWQMGNSEPGTILLTVEGRAIPYRLQRKISFTKPATVQLAYELENNGSERLNFLWAAHPQFVAGAHTAVVLPDSIDEVVNVLPSDTWGAEGQRFTWPRAISADGKTWQLDRIRSATHKDCRKFYLPPENPVAWAALVDHRRGCSLRVEWSSKELPYLGIWVDEGKYNSLPAVALEPSNGYYDSLARAYKNQRAAICYPGSKQNWTLSIVLSTT